MVHDSSAHGHVLAVNHAHLNRRALDRRGLRWAAGSAKLLLLGESAGHEAGSWEHGRVSPHADRCDPVDPPEALRGAEAG